MNLSQTVSKSNGRAGERRAWPRETLKDYVVLVFFEQDNWGKLTDINRNGMSFEFDRAPSFHRGVNFTFQVMGCTSVSRAGEMFGKSLQAVGDIVWMREFERMAGVQFADLPKESWEQIREWLSIESPARTPSFDEPTEEAEPVSPEELFVALAPEVENPAISKSETPAQTVVEPALPWPETAVAVPETRREVEPRFAERVFDERVPDALYTRPEPDRVSPPLRARAAQTVAPDVESARPALTILAILFAAVAVIAGVKLAVPWLTGPAGAVERVPGSTTRTHEPVVALPQASVETDQPFQVLVSDLSGKHTLLSFVRGLSDSGARQGTLLGAVSAKTTAPPASSRTSEAAAKPANDGALTPDEKLLSADKFELVTPKPGRTPAKDPAANELAAEPLAPPAELSAPIAASTGDILNYHAVPPPPPANFARAGGEVQQARLIKTVAPVYPALAKSSRVRGDVVVDALIDAAGNVTNVKVTSGPVLLQQAAVQAVRQWKYEPAQLDGQPVAMHLSLIVKFRLE